MRRTISDKNGFSWNLFVKDKTEFLKLIVYPFKGIQSINQFYLPLRSYLFIVDIR